jgi:hypothetical protein
MKSRLRILVLAFVVSPVLAAPATPSDLRPTAGDDPKADAPVTFDRAVSYWVHGAIGARALPDGGIKLVDSYDERLWSARLGPMGAKLAHGFDGPGSKIERALRRDGVEQRFVALAKTGAFGKGSDLTDAWQAWILKDGADTLRRESNHFAEGIMLAGLKLGADLSYTPDASADAVNSGVPKVDLEPAPAPAFPVNEVYSASRAPYAQMIRINKIEHAFFEVSDGTYRAEAKPTFEQIERFPVLGKEVVIDTVGTYADALRAVSSVRTTDGRLRSFEDALGLTDQAKPTYLVVTRIEGPTHEGNKVCVVSVVGVDEARSPDGKDRSYTSAPLALLSGCGLTPSLAATAKDIPKSRFTDPSLAADDDALGLEVMIAKLQGNRVVQKTVTVEHHEQEGGKQ